MTVDHRLREIFVTLFDRKSIEIRDDFGPQTCADWDSLASINLMYLVEREFGVEFRGSEFMEIPNFGTLRSFVERAHGKAL